MMRIGICFIILALFIEIVCVANGVAHSIWVVSALLTLIGLTLISIQETVIKRLLVKHEQEIRELKKNYER